MGMNDITFVEEPADPISYFSQAPGVECLKNCFYVPLNRGNYWDSFNWGIYDEKGELVEASAFYSLPNMTLTGQTRHCPISLDNVRLASIDQYMYMGNVIRHYGHFICTSMSRFWALSDPFLRDLPLLAHGAGGPNNWFNWDFARTLFGSGGLAKADFAFFDEPVRIKELFIANPSFHERNRSHSLHAIAGQRCGRRLTKTFDYSRTHEIIYLTKSNYAVNPDGISNEAEIASVFSEAGVWVISPEQLSIGEQIAYLRGARCIVGPCSSAFHTSVFFEPKKDQRFIQIVTSPNVCSTNHILMDQATGMKSDYVYFPGQWHERIDAAPGFRIYNPKAAGEALLQYARSV